MTNWTITNVSTEKVSTMPVRGRTRITRRGRVVVAVAYAIGALILGYLLIGATSDALDYEYNKALNTGTYHSDQIKAKKAGSFHE